MLLNKNIFYKLKEIAKDPRSYHLFLLGFLRRFQLKEVIKDNGTFFEYKGEFYPEYLNKGNAINFIRDRALKYCQGRGLDIGAGQWPLPGAIPVQNDSFQNAYNLDSIDNDSLDFVFSSHCLEHLYRWKDVLKLWASKLRLGGILFLYLPHRSMKLWNPGGPWVGGHHKWLPTQEVLVPFLSAIQMEIIDFNPERDAYWSFYIVAKKNN